MTRLDVPEEKTGQTRSRADSVEYRRVVGGREYGDHDG